MGTGHSLQCMRPYSDWSVVDVMLIRDILAVGSAIELDATMTAAGPEDAAFI